VTAPPAVGGGRSSLHPVERDLPSAILRSWTVTSKIPTASMKALHRDGWLVRQAQPVRRTSFEAGGDGTSSRVEQARRPVVVVSLPGRRAAGGRPQGRP
jgi:hypothetical protein